MLIQVVIRLILYTDQYVSRKGEKAVPDTNYVEANQEETKGIDNTVRFMRSSKKWPFIDFLLSALPL